MLETREEIEQWLRTYSVENYTVNENLTVDVDGSVYLDSQFRRETEREWLENLEELEEQLDEENQHEYMLCDDGSYERDGSHYIYEEKYFEQYELPVRFGKVSGSFHFQENNLRSLAGCPSYVGGDFDCQSCGLKSLEGGPTHVGGHFHASNNKLTSLVGAPDYVGKNFTCRNNELQTLNGAPREIFGKFDCTSNYLSTLEGAPGAVEKNFICALNPLWNLNGAPKRVGFFESDGDFPELHAAANPAKLTGEEFLALREKKSIGEALDNLQTESHSPTYRFAHLSMSAKSVLDSLVAETDSTPVLGSTSPHAAEPQQQPRAKPKFKL